MFFCIINTNNKPASLLSIRLLAVSFRIPLDFCWLCPLEFHQFWSFLVAGLLFVHWQSIGKVRWTKWSSQKCLDQLRKILGKILWSKAEKYTFCLPSVWSPLRKLTLLPLYQRVFQAARGLRNKKKEPIT